MRRRFILGKVIAAVALPAVLAASAGAAAPAWTTYRHDAGRSGIDPDSANPVTPSQAWQTPELDGQVYAQPLVYGSWVYVATENNTVYKLDAATGTVAWSRNLGTPEPSSAAPCGDVNPAIGITSTPVVDPSTDRIYAVGAVSASGVIHHELFALDRTSGQPITGFPIVVDPPFHSGGAPENQLQRAGLALDGGRILIGYGGNDGDCATYWGWLVSAPTDGTTGLGTFQADPGPGHHAGALWAAGNAPAVDAGGNVFVATGNGIGNSSMNPDYGDSVVKLNYVASPLGFWAPLNWQSLDMADADLGSSMPTLLPGGYVFQSGKDGNGYVLSGTNLGQVSSALRQASGFCSGGSFGGSVYDPANATIYAACSGGLRALSLGSGLPPSLTRITSFSAPGGAAGPPMIAGGLVWATNSGGTLYGLDLASGTSRSQFSIPESTSGSGSDVHHFASPSAGGGRLFVGSGDQVTAYTIAQPPPVTPTTTTLASSANPARGRTAVSLTAAVAPAPFGGAVSFTDSRRPIMGCINIPVSVATAGHAVCRTTFTRGGTHKLVASYSGDAYYAPSASPTLAESVSPVITRASIRPRRFTASGGTTLRLTLDEAARITAAATKLRHGHTVGHRCSLKAHKGKPCVKRVTLASHRFRAHAGKNKRKLRFRRLAPGHYTAIIYATDGRGLRSDAIRIGFTIIRPAHDVLSLVQLA